MSRSTGRKKRTTVIAIIFAAVILLIAGAREWPGNGITGGRYDDTEGIGTNTFDTKYEKAKVVSITDGDTFTVRRDDGSREKVRLILIDTPETKAPDRPVEPFGPEASAYTADLLTGQTVCLEYDVSERDRYGRLLAYAYVGDRMVNELLLEKGYARVAVFPPDVKYERRFRAIEQKARAAKLGIWSREDE